jgi:two-component system, cell cycle response regulator
MSDQPRSLADRSAQGGSSSRPPRLGDSSPPRPATIVVADDDRVMRDRIAKVLTDNGHHVEVASDGQEALEIVGRGGVDLVLLDVLMPRLNGIDACRIIKAMNTEAFLPVVLVTVKTDTASRVEGLKIGADDYVSKPFEPRELLARVDAMLRIKRLNEHLVAVRQKLERLSIYDELTGLYNYRYLHTRLGEEFKRAERYQEPLSCALLDVDHLKVHNEAGGEALGDAIVKGVAEVLKKAVRGVDVVARYGGEEFLVVLPSTHLQGSVAVAERVWRDVRNKVFATDSTSEPARVAVTIGVALYPSPDVKTKSGLLRAADAALTHAKRDGGDRVCVFQQHGMIYTPTALTLPPPKSGTPAT